MKIHASLMLLLVGCRPAHTTGLDDAGPPELLAATVPTNAPVGARAETASRRALGDCEAPPTPTASAGWRLAGWHPGPVLEDVRAVGERHQRLVGVTRHAVCTSDDEGETWTAQIGARDPLSMPKVDALSLQGELVAVSSGTADAPADTVAFRSRDLGARWEPLPLPAESGARVTVFTDGVRRVFAASATKLWVSRDGGPWEGPRALPGTRADQVDLCGDTLIARASLGPDVFHHRSEDEGVTWRPFRLGVLGLEGGNAMVRCLRWGGVIEAGRAPLPAWWSLDQGHTWTPARYDERAFRYARLGDEEEAGEPARCMTGPQGELACMFAHRIALPRTEGSWDRDHPVQEVVFIPPRCERARLLDDRRVMAFGAKCGVLLSFDRGGFWREMSAPIDRAQGDDEPRGGFVDRDVAWRLDGGLWWTHDAGAHWRLMTSTNSAQLTDGVFIDASRGVFVQRDGWVVATRNAGHTWTYVLRGEVERLARSGTWVTVTTTNQVATSSDGGLTWRHAAVLPRGLTLDPVVTERGVQRIFAPSPEVQVVQEGDRVRVAAPGASAELLRGLPAQYRLLSAHVTGQRVDRVLFTHGAVLARGS